MKRKILGLLVGLSLFFTPFGYSADVDVDVEWGYTNDNGPAFWPQLSPLFKDCANAGTQSPISIPTGADLTEPALSWHYVPGQFKMNRNQHNLFLYYTGNPGDEYINWGGKKYFLQEIHFHTPGEHQLDGKAFPMEAHFVHRNADGEELALGILLAPGSFNYFFSQLFTNPIPAPNAANQPFITLNPVWVLPARSDFYHYQGSLTTPPCGAITWVVLQQPGSLAGEQMDQFRSQVTAFNARPIQPLGNRVVSRGSAFRASDL